MSIILLHSFLDGFPTNHIAWITMRSFCIANERQLTWKLFATEVADHLDLKMYHPVVLVQVRFSVGGVAAEVALDILHLGFNLAEAWGKQLGGNCLLFAPLCQSLCILDPFWDALWQQPRDAIFHSRRVRSLLPWKSKHANSWEHLVGWNCALVQCHLRLNFHLGVWFQCVEKAASHLATSSKGGKTLHGCFILTRFWSQVFASSKNIIFCCGPLRNPKM